MGCPLSWASPTGLGGAPPPQEVPAGLTLWVFMGLHIPGPRHGKPSLTDLLRAPRALLGSSLMQPGMGSQIPKAGSDPGTALGPRPVPHPAAGPPTRLRVCQAPEMRPQPSVTHASAPAACTLTPLSYGQKGGLAPPLWRLRRCPWRCLVPVVVPGSRGGAWLPSWCLAPVAVPGSLWGSLGGNAAALMLRLRPAAFSADQPCPAGTPAFPPRQSPGDSRVGRVPQQQLWSSI